MYYENFGKLLSERNVRASDVAKATGIETATLSNWKNGNYTPKPDKLEKIADYFGVTVDYLLGRETPNEFFPEQAELDLMISQDMELKDALKIYFSLPDSKKKHIIETIKMLSEE
jgi:transcriptional regulator with XRE-family HTH domain